MLRINTSIQAALLLREVLLGRSHHAEGGLDQPGMFQDIVAYKHRQLKLAHMALLLGFVLLVVNIIVYLGWIPQVAPK